MKRLSGCWLAILIVSHFCGALMFGGEQRDRDIQKILSGFRGYHLLAVQERDSDTRAFILQHFPKSDPSVVHADFDGDGDPDYAMLLKSDSSATAKLVILLCDAPTQCRSVYEQDITGYSGVAYLLRLPVGSRVAESRSVEGENKSPVKLTNIGIQVTYFEKGKVALYWDKKLKKIVAVGTGE